MQKRGFRVSLLKEFYPDDITLEGMNTNYGQKIQLRLRRPFDVNEFIYYDYLLDVLLHE